jgi:hypothetical protein
MDMCCAIVSVFWLWRKIVFNVTYELTVQQRRNRDSEGRDNGQMTFLNFTSYIQNLRFFVFQMDGQTDRQTEKLIWCGLPSLRSSRLIRCGLGNLLVSPGNTCCAWAGGTFFRCLRKVPPANSPTECVVQELGW